MLRVACAVNRAVILFSTVLICLAAPREAANAAELYAMVGAHTPSPPIGRVQFCQTYATECDTKPLPPRDIVLSEKAWSDLKRMNEWVNHTIKPMTDTDHYGMIQWWRGSLPQLRAIEAAYAHAGRLAALGIAHDHRARG